MEVGKRPIENRLPCAADEAVQVSEIVSGTKGLPKGFTGHQKVAYRSDIPVETCGAITILGDRARPPLVRFIAHMQDAFVNEHTAMPTVSCRIDTIEDIEASRNGCDDVSGMSDAHEISDL